MGKKNKKVIAIGVLKDVTTPGTEPMTSHVFLNKKGQALRLDAMNASGEHASIIFDKKQLILWR